MIAHFGDLREKRWGGGGGYIILRCGVVGIDKNDGVFEVRSCR